jgi:hypothetical protein
MNECKTYVHETPLSTLSSRDTILEGPIAYPLTRIELEVTRVIEPIVELIGSTVIAGYLDQSSSAASFVSICMDKYQIRREGEENGKTYVWRKKFIISLLIEIGRFKSRDQYRINPFDPASTEIARNNYTKGTTMVCRERFVVHLYV